MKTATRGSAYKPSEWVLKKPWLFDRVKYLMMLKRYNYETMQVNNYALLNELDSLNKVYPEIYNEAWESYFNDGF